MDEVAGIRVVFVDMQFIAVVQVVILIASTPVEIGRPGAFVKIPIVVTKSVVHIHLINMFHISVESEVFTVEVETHKIAAVFRQSQFNIGIEIQVLPHHGGIVVHAQQVELFYPFIFSARTVGIEGDLV